MKRTLLTKLMLLLCALIVGSGSVWADDPVTLFLETFGSTTSNTAFASYSSYSATASMFTTTGTVKSHYSGSGSVGKNNLAAANLSNGYTGASGLSGCCHGGTANTEATIIQISNINIEGYENLSLSFGALGGSTSHKVDVSYIIDDGEETSLISNGSITNASWTLKSADISDTGTSLTIKIKHKPSKSWTIRLDDIKITGTAAAPTTYSVTYSANGGSGTMTDSSSPYAAGAEVTLLSNTFTAPSGKQWNSWAVTDASSNDVSVSNGKFTMPSSNVTVTAQWADITHTLTYSATNGSIGGVVYGTSTAVASGASVAESGKVTLTATPASGYTFSGWSVSGTGSTLSSTSDNPTTFTMGTADATVTATFALSDTRAAAGIAYTNAEESAVIAAGTSHKQTLTNPNSLEGVTYSSSNTDVATVASDGTVTLKKAGIVTITASFAGNEDYKPGSASYTLTITDKYVATLIFDADAVSKNAADAAFINEIATDPDPIGVVYSSSSADVATVNSSTGEVTIVAPGSATIKATIDDDDYEATEFTYSLTVSKANTTLSLDENEVEQDLKDGRTVTLTPTVKATRSDDSEVDVVSPTVTWTSSDESVATVSGGVVTGLKAGTTTITASYAGGANYNAATNATCSVTLTDTRTAVNISTFAAAKTELVIDEEQATTITNDQAGWTAAYTYSSSNTDVATVDEDGVITAVAKGTATITATVKIALDETGYKAGATKTLNITVTKPFHTVTFFVNGNTDRTASVEEDANITFPTAADTPADASEFNKTLADGKTFQGWYTAEYSHATTAPASYVNTSSTTMSTSDVTYYAVYAEEDESNIGWYETDLADITSSDVFVFAKGTTYAIKNSGGTSESPKPESITVLSGKITSTVTDAMKWKVSGNATDGYTFLKFDDTKKWLYCSTTASSGSNDNLRVGTGDRKLWVFNANNYLVTNDDYTDRYFSMYSSTDFRSYINTSNGAFVPSFYKYQGVNYTNFTTDNRSAAGLAYTKDAVDVKLTSGYTGQALTNPNSLTVTYSSSDETVATVNSSTGAVELLKAGSTTITATFAGNATYKPAEVSYTLNVTEKTPAGLAYATSEVAKVTTDAAFTNSLTNSHSLTVSYSSSATGVATVNSSTGEVTIKGAGETTITAAFAGNDDYEAGNASYTLTVSKATPTLSFASENAIGREGEAFVGNALTNPASLTVTYSSSDTDVATVNSSTGAVTIVAAGTTTITASFAGNDTYASGSASYTLKVLATPTITVSDDEVAYGETYTYSAGASDTGGDITVTSGNTSIATVDGLEITPVACGEVEITVSRAETDTYKADSQTFTLTVTAPAGSAEVLEDVIASFDFTDNTDWEFPTSETSTTTSYDNGDYEITLAGPHYFQSTNKYLMLKGSTGVLTFPAFDKKVSSIEIVGKSGASTSTKENIYVGTKAVSKETTGSTGTNTFAIDDDYQDIGTIYSLKVTDKNAQITAINVYTKPSSATVTLNKYGYATYCSLYPIDFSSTSGYTAWRVSSIEDGVISFAKITEKIKGGQGVLLYNKNADGVNTSSATIKFADGTTEFDEDKNLLVGTTAPTYFVEDSFYGLSGNQFLKNNTCTLPAGKAYLPYDKVDIGSGVRNFTFVFEDNVTGIETIQNVSDEVIFDMTGRRLNRLQKGVNIVNGKKVLVK